jgi:hypothetical protein
VKTEEEVRIALTEAEIALEQTRARFEEWDNYEDLDTMAVINSEIATAAS